MYFGSSCIRGSGLPVGDGLIHTSPVRTETLREPLEKSEARPGRGRRVTGENVARKRNAGGLAPTGQKIFAELDKAFGAGRRLPAPVACQQSAAALGDSLQQFAEKRSVHFSVRDPWLGRGTMWQCRAPSTISRRPKSSAQQKVVLPTSRPSGGYQAQYC